MIFAACASWLPRGWDDDVAKRELLILDACVLIDYLDVEEAVLGEVAHHVGTVHVASSVLREVGGLDNARAAALGIQVVEPELELLARAAVRRASLSFPDHVCLLLARERGWTCVTSDGALRRACLDDGVAVLWGLELLRLLVEQGVRAPQDAIRVAEGIAGVNAFITEAILERFRRRVRGIE